MALKGGSRVEGRWGTSGHASHTHLFPACGPRLLGYVTSPHSRLRSCSPQPMFIVQSMSVGKGKHAESTLFRDGSEPLGPPEGAQLLGHGSSSSLRPPLRGPRSLKFCLGGAHPPGPLDTGPQRLLAQHPHLSASPRDWAPEEPGMR